jgi:putative phage-type endonuclease
MAQTHQEWLEARRKGLGGSDIAGIMGLSPWKSTYQIYMDKKGRIPFEEENDQMKWGKLMEPTLRQFYSNTTGRLVRVPDGIIYHPEYPFLFANPDGITDDRRVVELKTARYNKGWGEPGTNEVPDAYALQVQHYMFVLGFDVTDVVVSIGGGYPVLYIVPADPELQALILEAGLKFWKDVQEGNEPSPVSFSDAVSKFGLSGKVGVVYGDDTAVTAAEELKQVEDQIGDLETQADTLKAKLVVALGETGDTLLDSTGRMLCTFKQAAGRKTIDTKRLEAERPEIYAEYLKVGAPSNRFLLKI